jgi:hypothetical protein
MVDALDSFDAIGVVVDWIDACKQDDLLTFTMRWQPLNAARAAAFEVDLRWKATGRPDWRDRAKMLSRSTH